MQFKSSSIFKIVYAVFLLYMILVHFVFCIIIHMDDTTLNKKILIFFKWLPKSFVI